MRNIFFVFLTGSLLTACGSSEKNRESTPPATTTQPATASVSPTDSAAATASEQQNCQSVVLAGKLGKADTYRESAKSITVALTIDQDSSTTQTDKGCYFNNTATVLATKKSGSQLFKRTLLKDDLLPFTKSDGAIRESVLQQVLYKPTFNGERYLTLTMKLMEPASRKTSSYTVFMNYFGEIVKVK